LDWLSDSEVAMMTFSEKGLFIDMLSRCFNEDGLPADEKKLLRLFKCNLEDLRECIKMFYEKDEKLFNKKLDSIKKDQRKVSTGRSKAGKISAQKRKNQQLTKSTNVEQMLNSVATKPQQNSTNTTQQNRTQQSKEKEDKKEPSDVDVILSYLNEKTGKSFRTAPGLKERINEGYKVEDFKKVIDNKCASWQNDSNMKQYLRPQTLFSQKFDSYLNEDTVLPSFNFDTAPVKELNDGTKVKVDYDKLIVYGMNGQKHPFLDVDENGAITA
jgi:uncharacterized phage protein (TIGR02220 family)